MMDYEGWRGKVKDDGGDGLPVDYDQLLTRIKHQAVARPRQRALAGMLAVLLIATAVYFGQVSTIGGNGDQLMSYVFDQGSVDGPLLDYVLSE